MARMFFDSVFLLLLIKFGYNEPTFIMCVCICVVDYRFFMYIHLYYMSDFIVDIQKMYPGNIYF